MTTKFGSVATRLAFALLFLLGVANLSIMDIVPGVIYIASSLMYFPFTSNYFRLSNTFKLLLFLLIIAFTLGASDLESIIEHTFMN